MDEYERQMADLEARVRRLEQLVAALEPDLRSASPRVCADCGQREADHVGVRHGFRAVD